MNITHEECGPPSLEQLVKTGAECCPQFELFEVSQDGLSALSANMHWDTSIEN